MKTFYAAAAAVLISLAGTGMAAADDISADVLTYNGQTQVATARGNVVIHANEGATMIGASGEYHFKDGSAYLTGGVHYARGASTMSADTVHVLGDKTIRGVGSVDLYDGEAQRTVRGEQVTYNPDTGFSRVEGSAYVSTPDGSLTAPLIEGNAREIRFTATGGVQFESDVHQLSGSGDQAVYTKSPDAEDGKVVLTGNAYAVQNGNAFRGPELIFELADNFVQTKGRSTLIITNTGSSAGDTPEG